jgi:general secretion pathway protein J
MRCPFLNNKGFTLLELLVALVLLVILSGALYGTYFSVVRGREKGGARIEARRELSVTLDRLTNELNSAYFQRGDNKDGRLFFKVEDRDQFGKPTSLVAFSYLAPPSVNPPGSDLTQVQYGIKEKDEVLTLVRQTVNPYWDIARKSTPFPVIDVVDGFLVECYDGSKWVRTWDTALNNRLPDRVRVTLTLKGGEIFSAIATPRISQ